MKINQLKAGSILTYVQMALGIVIGLVYTPVMIRLLGQNEYGLYNTVSSTISMLSILSLGFGSSYVRYFSKYKTDGDRDSIAKLNGLFIIVFTVIGAIALACGLYLTFNLELVFDNGLTETEYETAKVLMLLLSVSLAVSFPMSVFSSIINANECFVFFKLLGMLKTVFSPIVTLPLLLMGYRSIAMVLVTVIIGIITDIIYTVYVFAKLKEKFVFKAFEKGILKSLFVFTSFIAINIIVDQINFNIPKLLLGRYCGTAVVAVYAVGSTLYSYYIMFSTAVSGVLTPRIHHIINKSKGDIKELKASLTDIFIRVGRIQFIILALVATGIIFFGKSFILNIWAGEGYEEAYYVVVMLVLSGMTPLIQNLGIEIQRALNLHKFRSIVYLIMAGLNFVLSIILCPQYGAVGATVGTVVSMTVANGFIMNVYYNKKCHIDILAYWKSIIMLARGLIIPIITGIVILKLVDLNRLLNLAACILLYSVIYTVSMWFLGMNDYERELVLVPIKRIAAKLNLIKG